MKTPRTGSLSHIDGRNLYRRLERWFARHARRLPWRGETDPYRVWVSEILLIQTTVAVGVKRYPRFLHRFPTVRSLAKSSLSAVLKEWEGLGYYHRARYLHQAARQIMKEHGGVFPRDHASIRSLPGVGDYVAAALGNFCFGGRRPPIDANIARVAARLFAIPGDVRSARVRGRVCESLEPLMQEGRGALWTDALIEVGALVCSPRNPQCDGCPLAADCRARYDGTQERHGMPLTRERRRDVNVACGIIRRADGRILIARRLETGLLPGLWEFPGGKRHGNEALTTTCEREIAEELGIRVLVGRRCLMIRHAYSHYRVRLHVFECQYGEGRPRAIGCRSWKWARPQQLADHAFPAADRRIIDYILRTDGGNNPR